MPSASAKLREMKRAVAATASPFAQVQAVQILGRSGLDLATESVASAKGPTGAKWAPLAKVPIAGGKARVRDAKGRFAASNEPELLAAPTRTPLRKLVGTVRLQTGIARFFVTSTADWYLFHHKGAWGKDKKPKWRLPKRSFLPKNTLSRKWAQTMMLALQTGLRAVSKSICSGSGTFKASF